MKLIQINIWQGRTLRSLLRFLEAEKPDIICMQEVLSTTPTSSSWDMIQSLEKIQAATGLEHAFMAPTADFRLMDVHVKFGNAILSRYPLTNQQTVFTYGSLISEAVMATFDSNTRNAQIATIEVEGKVFTVVNHHAYWETSPVGSATSREALQRLIAALKPLEGPLIVAGDFNLDLRSEVIGEFERELGLRNLTRENKVTTTLSELGHPVQVACDYIFVRGDITVEQFEVSPAMVSDHKPLILKFSLQ